MAEKFNFTKQGVEALPVPGKRIKYRDKVCKYLYLESYPSGKKVFLYIRCVNYKTTPFKIGYFPELNVAEARIEADRLSTEIAKGKDPLRQRKEKRLGETFGELFNTYYEQHLKPNCRTHEEELRKFKTYLGDIASQRANEITQADINILHKKIIATTKRKNSGGKVMANRAIMLIRQVFNFGIECGLKLINPAASFKKAKEESREKFLDAIELKRFFEALKFESTTWQHFFLLCLFTGARRSNVLSMHWNNIDIERRIWRIPAQEFKTGKAKEVVLSTAAISVLKERAAISFGYVFPSDAKSGHIEEPKSAWERIRIRSGLKEVRIHDLRRTHGSWQAATGASLAIIGKSLGHDSTQATAIYARLNTSSVEQAVEKATQAMLEAAR
ncbi:MAG TPA: recombinase XerD [Lentisphaeria bacterium]|nr:MAG: hypothetical protein A2X47_10780 [Lentisphaerae bacterium GWF2_38_69]HBM15772.1 recombinase XerD [Lentisphaeria bacterium]